MIGSVWRNKHELYGTDLWRIPHNPGWPESGVGLASEFGVGDDGAFCNYKCGWYESQGVSNGVLGYIEAKNGEPFLKIGVGMLEKGSCYACDSSEDYKFNSPYAFAQEPVWTMTDNSPSQVQIEHEEVLHAKKLYGYRLKKRVHLENNVLSVTSTLTNLGQEAFTTPWYSHHFFSCDGRSIGPGYSVELDVKPPQSGPIYEEPSLWSWSTPLRNFAQVTPLASDKIEVQFERPVDDGARVKAEFQKDDGTGGGFTLNGCGSSIKEDIPEVLGTASNEAVSMYAFNLYVERGTLSPEPQLLIRLDPGKTTTWTQRLEFSSRTTTSTTVPNNNIAGSLVVGSETAIWKYMGTMTNAFLLLFVSVMVVSATYHVVYNCQRFRGHGYSRSKSNYTPIPDASQWHQRDSSNNSNNVDDGC